MSAKLKPQMPAEKLAQYTAAVKATPGVELKGASMPYTAVNGNMNSFLDKLGTCAVRLSKSDRDAFMQEFASPLYKRETGALMTEYVTVPPSLLGDVKAVAGWLKKSLAYAKTLKPKATTKKKSAGMKTILAYGDSLTYGASPVTGGPRHAYGDRWPSVLEAAFGGTARVVAEGLGGRTTAHDDWFANADRNGARILPTLLESHSPLDLVMIMLGTNDLKPFLGRTAAEAGRGMGRLVQVVRGFYASRREKEPAIILVAPPVFVESDNADMTGHFGGRGIVQESWNFAAEYKRRADEHGVHFFDAATVAKTDPRDGIHLDALNTRAIGEGVVPLVRQVLGF